jgi:hypothetical protein
MLEGDAPLVAGLNVHHLQADCTVMCVVVATAMRSSVVVNSAYPAALDHAKIHMNNGGRGGVWICGPECDGA